MYITRSCDRIVTNFKNMFEYVRSRVFPYIQDLCPPYVGQMEMKDMMLVQGWTDMGPADTDIFADIDILAPTYRPLIPIF